MKSILLACCLAVVAAGLCGQEPALTALPEAVRLDHAGDVQGLIVLDRTPGGATRNRTAEVEWTLDDPALAEITRFDDRIALRGVRDGATTLHGRLGDTAVRVAVTVRDAATLPPASFANEVIPVLTRAGCNAGACHGAAAGKNGFALSLFGYDPARDHAVLTRELRSRRLDPADPERSLLLRKATTGVVHQGGKRLERDGAGFALLARWIGEGAGSDLDAAPALLGVDLLPAEAILAGAGQRLPLLLRARYADGSDRDVTALALWSSGNEQVARVADDGTVTAGERGQACVLARYGGFAVVAQLTVRADDRPFAWPAEVTAVNFVDAAVHRRLQAVQVAPAAVCDDATFLRRVHLDLCNVPPTPAEARAFLADADSDKRSRLVDALLQRPETAATLAMAWAEVLQVDAGTMEPKGAALLQRWLQDAFAARRPLDQIVRELLVAEGATFAVPAANFHLVAVQPHLLAEKVAQNFLGIRLQCAQCHNHPFENWTMDDYYGFAAFFGQVGRKRLEDPSEQLIWDRRNGDVRNLRDNAVAPPRLLGGGPATIPAGTDRRAVLADWLVAADNRFFARNLANRLWARLLGRGLVDPPDDVRVSNPPSHPELLDQLAGLLVQHRFDPRPVLRAICLSRTYQQAVHPDQPDPALFAGVLVRRLEAEQLLDAIGAVTGVPTKYAGAPLGSNATMAAGADGGVPFLQLFGRPNRDSACTCDRRGEPTLGQTLHLINGETIAGKIADRSGRLRRALAAGMAPSAMLDELFLAAYARPPRAEEATRLLAALPADGGEAAAAWQDIYWAVLNSREFAFQH